MAGVNTVILESTDDYAATMKNLAFTLALYSGQMCTTTQNILIPQGGIASNDGHKASSKGQDLGAALDALLADPRVATAVLGAIASPATAERIAAAAHNGKVVHARKKWRTRSSRMPCCKPAAGCTDRSRQRHLQPGMLWPGGVSGGRRRPRPQPWPWHKNAARRRRSHAGPALATRQLYRPGGQTEPARKVALSVNLTQGIYVNQSALLRFPRHRRQPGGQCQLLQPGLVADRFVIVQAARMCMSCDDSARLKASNSR